MSICCFDTTVLYVMAMALTLHFLTQLEARISEFFPHFRGPFGYLEPIFWGRHRANNLYRLPSALSYSIFIMCELSSTIGE